MTPISEKKPPVSHNSEKPTSSRSIFPGQALDIISSLGQLAQTLLHGMHLKKEVRIAPTFFQIFGGKISQEKPCYLMGIQHERAMSYYPEDVISKLQASEQLVSELPSYKESIEKAYSFNAECRNLIREKYMEFENNKDWFRDRLKPLYSESGLEHVLQVLEDNAPRFRIHNYCKEVFNKKELDQINLVLKKYNQTSDMHPFFVEETLGIDAQLKNHPGNTVDLEILKYFKANKREIVELDTKELSMYSFMRSFVVFLEGYALTGLTECLSNIELLLKKGGGDDCYADRDDEWSKGDTFKIDELKSEKENDESNKLRNIAWREHYLRALESGKSTSIVVGSAHLEGSTGLLQSLENSGYKIVRLPIAKAN